MVLKQFFQTKWGICAVNEVSDCRGGTEGVNAVLVFQSGNLRVI